MDVVVVGAGLAGLTVADQLNRVGGVQVEVLEARNRIGGRIHTVAPEAVGGRGWLDLGATWHWTDQPEIAALGRELGLATFPQFGDGHALVEDEAGTPPRPTKVPPPAAAELRFVGGAQALCSRLAERLPAECVSVGLRVTALTAAGGGVTVEVEDAGELEVDFAVVAVPPRLALQRIVFTPEPPEDLATVVNRTPTWMGNAVKVVAVYESAFWREQGRSGAAFSDAGPLREVFDACTDDGSVAALWGFVSADDEFREIGSEERAELVLDHLGRLFGAEAADPLQYVERDWSSDPNTKDEVWWVEGDLLEYGHPVFTRPLCGGRVVWAGAETVAEGGGHMEGAVRSGRRAARAVLEAAGITGPFDV